MSALRVESGFAHAAWRNISIAAWSVPPTIPHLRALAATQRRLSDAHPRGIGVVNLVVGVPTSTIDPEVRVESESMIRTFAPCILAIATVLEAKGFVASVARGVLLSQRMVSRHRYPEKVFDRAEEVEAWLLPTVGPHEQGAGFCEALLGARAALAGGRA